MPVQRAVRPRQGRALLARTVGQRDDVVEAAVDQLRDRLRASGMPVDADFGESSNGQRVNPAWTRAGRESVEIGAAEPGEQRLGDLAAGRVAVADEQHADRGGASIRSAIEIDGSKRPLEVDELDLEPIEVFTLSCDLAALLLERRSQRDVGHLAFDEAIDQPSRLRRGEAEPPEREDQRESGEVALAVLAVAVVPPYGRRKDACCFVPAHTGRRDADAAGEGGDVHISTINLVVTVRSSPLSQW